MVSGRRWLRDLAPGRPGSPRLICLPHAGGGASAFHPWRTLATDVTVSAVQLPGREDRFVEDRLTDVDTAARIVADRISAESPGAYALFGHSLGALLAFEAARHLCAAGAPPLAVYVAGQAAPHLHPPADMYAAPDDELIAYLRSLGGIRDEVFDSPELLALLLPIIRADLQMSDTYVYRDGAALPCPLRALHGEDDNSVSKADTLGWAEHSSDGFRFESFAGDHFFITQQAEQVLGWVRDDLQNAQRSALTPPSG